MSKAKASIVAILADKRDYASRTIIKKLAILHNVELSSLVLLPP